MRGEPPKVALERGTAPLSAGDEVVDADPACVLLLLRLGDSDRDVIDGRHGDIRGGALGLEGAGDDIDVGRG